MSAETTVNCPSCRRPNRIASDRQNVADCSRCGCELESLAVIRETAEARAREACAALATTDYPRAGCLAWESWELHPGPTAATCGFLASVSQGDLATAMLWKTRAARG